MNHEPKLPGTNPPTKEGWEEEFDAKFPAPIFCDHSNHDDDSQNIKSFIRTLLAQARSEGSEKYQELMLAVESVHPGETRHETALRYIREREMGSTIAARNDTSV